MKMLFRMPVIALLFTSVACGSGGTGATGGGSASGGGSGGGTAGGSGGGTAGGSGGGTAGGTGGGSGGGTTDDGGNYVRANINGTPIDFSGPQPFPLQSLAQVTVTAGFAMHSCTTDDCFELTASKSLPYMGLIVDYRDAGVPGQNYYCWAMSWNDLDGGYRQTAANGCTVQLTSVAHDAGQVWTGTFSGTLKGDGGDIVVTNGDFRARRR